MSSPLEPADLIGRDLGEFSVIVEADPLALFCQVIGETDPVYTSAVEAQKRGYPERVLPPSYLFGLERRTPNPGWVLDQLGIDLREVLHGEQSFVYHSLAFVGDELVFAPRFADYYEKKGGALRFLVRETSIHRGVEHVADLKNVLVVRQLELT